MIAAFEQSLLSNERGKAKGSTEEIGKRSATLCLVVARMNMSVQPPTPPTHPPGAIPLMLVLPLLTHSWCREGTTTTSTRSTQCLSLVVVQTATYTLQFENLMLLQILNRGTGI